MNISGSSVCNALRNTVKSTESMIVIHDSLSHKQGKVSYKLGGSANGHNGVRSVIAGLGGKDGFHRIRVGIGKTEVDAAEYVLQKLSADEIKFWREEGLGLVLDEVGKVVMKKQICTSTSSNV